MPKKIIVCCDGTGNSFDNPDNDSNVLKLYSCLKINDEQRGYYHPGVGTMGSQSARNHIERVWSRVKGMAFGAGLLDNVGDAYRYLMETYEDGDQIYLFGFSRGAYTVRVLASVLHVFGLLCAGNQGLIPYILKTYQERSKKAKHAKSTFAEDKAFKWQFSHKDEVRIHFCGLWDTVSTYGWIYDPIDMPFLGSNPIIAIGRQAISMHERRAFYQDNLWGKPAGTQDFRQVWFSGVHSDVGGSYPERQSGLAKIPLEWIIVEAQHTGLKFDCDRVETILGQRPVNFLPMYVEPDVNAPMHNSLTGLWWLAEILPQHDPHVGRKIYFPLGRGRKIPDGSIIHASALERRPQPGDPPRFDERRSHQVEQWIRYERPLSESFQSAPAFRR
jgi:uncharacterized protein (DUF2235 family)